MAKSDKKIQARAMRRDGESIKVIAKKLYVSVGSVSTWCHNIELSPEQIANLSQRSRDPFFGKKASYMLGQRAWLNQKIDSLLKEGISELGQLSTRDIFITGIALYWGEGFKKDHQVGLATSDKDMAKFFIMWLSRCFSINKEDLLIRITVNESYKDRIDFIEQFWSSELGLDKNIFSKPFFQNVSWKKKYENESEYHGVVRIRVKKSMDFLRKIKGYLLGMAQQAHVTSQKRLPTVHIPAPGRA